MSHDDAASNRDLEVQRQVARIALASVEGFALAGSSAIREHGIINRPTEDVDLFTIRQDVTEFGVAVNQISTRLRGHGFTVDLVRRAPQFARLHVCTNEGYRLDVDLGVDWRRDEPVQLEIGPVLSLADAVGNKISALYSRVEPRDFLDVDSIRGSGRFGDDELIAAAADRDPGFESGRFALQLLNVRRLTPRDVRSYGVTAEQLEEVKLRCTEWATAIQRR